jgi:midasin
MSQRLASIHQSSGVFASSPTVSDVAFNTEESVTRMYHAISETIDKIKELGGLPGAPPAPDALLDGTQMLLSSTQECRDVLRSIVRNLKETGLHILLRGSFYLYQSPPRIESFVADELDAVAFAQQHITNAQNVFLGYEQSFPQFRLIILPLRNWLASQILCTPRENQPLNQSNPGSGEVIEALLKSIQSILSAIPVEDQSPSPSQDNYLKDTSLALIRVGDLLRVDSQVTLLNSWIERLVGCSPEDIKQNISRLLPFIQRYTLVVENQLACMARWVNSLFKLQFAACSVMLNIATNGFCKPPDGEEPGDESPEHENSAGGVGFGEGAGDENVSKEVEDESQVEGFKDEGGESNRKKDEETDDDAIEIGDDFQGDLEDIAENGSEDERCTEEDGDGLEEKLANLDAGDLNSVDEKLWGDEADPQDESKEGKRSKDQSDKPSDDSEVVAKDNELSKEKKSDDRNTVDESSNAEAKDEDMLGDEADEDNREDAAASSAALDDFVQDPETLDLPDGLEMGEDTAPQDVDEEVDDDMLCADGTIDSLNGDNEMQLENSSEPPSQRDDDINNGATSDDQRQEGGETDTGLEDSYPEGDINIQPDMRTGDETTNEPVPDHCSNTNMRDNTSESPSGGSRGAMATSTREEGRGDDTSVYSLYNLLICCLTCVSASFVMRNSREQLKKMGKAALPMPVPRLIRHRPTKISVTGYPMTLHAVLEMPLRRLSWAPKVFLRATKLQLSRQSRTSKLHTFSTSTKMMPIMTCKPSGLRASRKLPSLETSAS